MTYLLYLLYTSQAKRQMIRRSQPDIMYIYSSVYRNTVLPAICLIMTDKSADSQRRIKTYQR